MTSYLSIGEQIYQSPFKAPGDGTYLGRFASHDVIIKRGDDRLLHEAEILRRTDHDSIPKLLDITQSGDTYQLVMSRLAGVPLHELIELQTDWTSRPTPIDEAVRIARGAVAAFRAVRRSGYIYRDLNLGHLIIDSDSVGLCDHEADILADAAGIGTVDSLSGTWETMAPEEFTVGNQITESSNTYTLGVLLHQLIMGSNPYRRQSPEGSTIDDARELAYQAHLQGASSIGSGAGAVDRLIAKALSPNPADRYRTLADFDVAITEVYS